MSEVRVDLGIVEDALTFMALGLEPGGCTYRMILGDLDGARARCHPHGLPHIEDTFAYVRKVVSGIRFDSREDIESWQKHKGLSGADATFAIQIKLASYETYTAIVDFIAKYRS